MTTAAHEYRAAADPLSTVIEGVEDWSAASPCAGWTVADVVDHIIDTQRDFLTDRDLDLGPRPGGSPDRAWAVHRRAVEALIADPQVAQTPYEGFFGPTTIGENLCRFYGFDMVAHRWDIATGSGQPCLFTDAELDELQIRVEGFGAMLYTEGICEPALQPAPDASRQTRVLALLGRRG